MPWPRSASRSRSSSAGARSAPATSAHRGDAPRPPPRAGRLAQGAREEQVRRPSTRRPRRTATGRAGPGRTAPRSSCSAGELLATSWRATLNAATMLGQSKTVFQAEIDAACELIDFWRFNPYYAQQLYGEQPLSDHAMWNQLDYRAPGGLRLRGHALQLHLHRRQPAHRARAHGQHGAVEAGLHGDARAPTTSCSCWRRRGCRPASSTSCPATPPTDLRRGAHHPRPGRRALHRHHGRLQQHVEDDRREHGPLPLATRASWARRAARTSSSPTPPPIPQALAVAIVRGRLRVPGTEVLGGQPGLRAALAVGRRAGPRWRP